MAYPQIDPHRRFRVPGSSPGAPTKKYSCFQIYAVRESRPTPHIWREGNATGNKWPVSHASVFQVLNLTDIWPEELCGAYLGLETLNLPRPSREMPDHCRGANLRRSAQGTSTLGSRRGSLAARASSAIGDKFGPSTHARGQRGLPSITGIIRGDRNDRLREIVSQRR